jgi:hypothetical protein
MCISRAMACISEPPKYTSWFIRPFLQQVTAVHPNALNPMSHVFLLHGVFMAQA